MTAPIPTKITLNKKSRTLVIDFDTGEHYVLACAELRAASLSAEMRQAPGQANYDQINILSIEPVGNYAIKPTFSDGHNTGIYSWDTLYHLCKRSKQDG